MSDTKQKEIHLSTGAVMMILASDAQAMEKKGMIYACGDHFHFADGYFSRDAVEDILEYASNSDVAIYGGGDEPKSIGDIFAGIMKAAGGSVATGGPVTTGSGATPKPPKRSFPFGATNGEAVQAKTLETPDERLKRRLRELNASIRESVLEREKQFQDTIADAKAEAYASGLTNEDILKALMGSLTDGLKEAFKQSAAA